MSRGALAVIVLGVAGSLAGCGSAATFPPAAEPPTSPPLKFKPAGKVVKVGEQPEGLAADSRTGLVAVGLRNPDRLALVRGENGRVIRRVRLAESPRHLQLARAGGPVLVSAERANELVEVGLDGRIQTVSRVGQFPHDATASAGRVFVANETGNSISVLQDGQQVRTLPAPQQPGGIAATAQGDIVTVAVRERVLRAYDADSLAAGPTVGGGVGPTHIISDCSERVYVADTQGHAVLAYRTTPRLHFADRINLPAAPYGLAVDCRRRLLWVTEPSRNRLVELRIPRYQGAVRLVRSYATVRQPNSVTTDAASGRVFVAGRTDGVLQIIEPRPPTAQR